MNVRLMLAKVLRRWKRDPGLQATVMAGGRAITIPNVSGLGWANRSIDRSWLDELIEQYLPADGTFVDVGMNVGQTLIRTKTARPDCKYLGFEPSAACVSYVQSLIESNGFSDCTIYNCALSSELQQLALEQTAVGDTGASVVDGFRPGLETSREAVLGVRFDALFRDRPIDLVKIDVEGAELDVVRGMRESIIRWQPVIVCEVLDSHNDSVIEVLQQRADSLSQLLSDLGYTIVQLETSADGSEVMARQPVTSIEIQPWTTRSLQMNDYMFLSQRVEREDA